MITTKNISDWSKTGFPEWKQEQNNLAGESEPQPVTRALAAQVHPEGRLTQTVLNDYLLGFMAQRALESLKDPELIKNLHADPDKMTRSLPTLAKLQSGSTERLQTEMQWHADRQKHLQQNSPANKRRHEELEQAHRQRLEEKFRLLKARVGERSLANISEY